MSSMPSQITSITIVYSNVYSGTDKKNHQSSAALAFAFVRGIHRWPVNSPHKGPVTRKIFPFGDVIMSQTRLHPSLLFIPTSFCKTSPYISTTHLTRGRAVSVWRCWLQNVWIMLSTFEVESQCFMAAAFLNHWWAKQSTRMMTSSNGSIFRVTGHVCGEFTGPRWIPHTKASDAELWCLLWSVSE